MNNTYKLNNGKTIQVVGFSDWSNILVKLAGYESVLCIVDSLIHSMTDYEEPCSRLKADYQLTPSELARIRSDYPNTCSFYPV
ncbi:hypothetical protein [Cysteiniphilum marinum]|uniref:hypothetical protein n=1 Tax=Cysteiniphilum marinum TaxID=2774191 RepID=UPI00193A1637|nr:hypothetical protein [Cysteiniphilum marinum]